MASDKTVISFKFLRPGGFSVSGHGNFNPELKPILLTEQDGAPPKMLGNTWVIGYDFDQVYKIELDSERVRELPAHILGSTDEATRVSFRERAATKAAEQHELNNQKRDELRYHEGTGLIKIISDSFFDEESKPSKPGPGRPRKTEEKTDEQE